MKYLEDLRKIPQENSTSYGEKMLLYWLVRELRPKTVVETGTHQGGTTAFLAHAVLDNGFGHVYTCDPTDYGRVQTFPIPELRDKMTYKQCKSIELEVPEIDFLFIDGDHIAEKVIEEMEHFNKFLSPHAIVVFHDCWPAVSYLADVNSALEGLKTAWLPTSHALQIYTKGEIYPKPKDWSLPGIYD